MRLNWKSALGIVLSAALLVWTLRGESPAEIWSVISQSNLALLVLSSLVATAIFPLRAIRWRVILEPVAPDLPFGPLWRSTAIGVMVNNVVPARAGEFARAFALAREVPNVPFATALASLAVDRMFDAVVVLLLLFAAMFDPIFPRGTLVGGQPVSNWAGGGIIAVAAILVALYAIVFFPTRVLTLFELLVRRIAPKLEARGRDAIVAFSSGLGVLRAPKRFASVFLWTLAHWLLNALAFWVGFRAVGISVPFSASLFIQGIIAIGVALPSAPGFFGVFEVAAKAGLAVYGVGPDRAVAWAIGYHILSFIPITVIGAVYFARLGMRMGELQSAGERKA